MDRMPEVQASFRNAAVCFRVEWRQRLFSQSWHDGSHGDGSHAMA
jgi:hypothetical protein